MTDRQETLLGTMAVLAWLTLAQLAAATILRLVDEVAATYVLAAVCLATVGAMLLVGRSLRRTGPPFDAVRWYWPWAPRGR
jgi:hypothetical protein